MKKVILAILQFALFFVVFAAGSFLPPFHLRQVLSVTEEGTHVFFYDGVVLMTALFAVIVLIEAVRGRLRTAAPWTAAAFVLACAAGLAAKLGFLTIPR